MRWHRLSAGLLVGSLLALAAAVPGLAEPAPDGLAVTIAQNYQAFEARLATLRAASDLATKLELAKVLIVGVPVSADNPLRRPDVPGANALLDAVLAGNDPALRLDAEETRADLLQRSPNPAEINAGRALEAQLASQGYPTAVARIFLRDGLLPAGTQPDAAKAALEQGVLASNSSAAFALAKLLAASDPDRSKALLGQGLVFLAASADTDPIAAVDLAKHFLSGDGVAKDPAKALTLLTAAAGQGVNVAVSTLNGAVLAQAPGFDFSRVRSIILNALSGGSSRAASLIVADLIKHPVYGFTRDEGLYAISLLAGEGDRGAMLVAAKAFVRGLGGGPDLPRAIPYLEKLSDVAGLSSDEVLRLGNSLEHLDLPPELTLKYIEPLYRGISDSNHAEAEYRADHVLALATSAGAISATTIGKEQIAAMLTALQESGTGGHAPSLMLLGDVYYGGIWVPVDRRRALQYYQQSIAIEPSVTGSERYAKALLATRNSPFEDDTFRQLVATLAGEGDKWGETQVALLKITDGTDIAAGEASLLHLGAGAYAPATRAFLRHLGAGSTDKRIADALTPYLSSWTLRKDVVTGRLLGEFYGLVGRLGDARTILGDPIFASDALATLMLAKLELAAQPADAAAVLELAQHGFDLAADNQPQQLAFAQIMGRLTTDDARLAARKALGDLADAGNAEAIATLIPMVDSSAGGSDPATIDKWSATLAASGDEAAILSLATRYLTHDANPAIAARVFAIARTSLAALPPGTDVAALVAEADYFGYGTSKDIAAGDAVLQPAAAAGSKEAVAELGRQFYYGIGRPADQKTGLALLQSASSLGSDTARVELGRLYSSGNGPELDAAHANGLFVAAAADGSLPAMVEMGRAYLAGSAVDTNDGTGTAWLERAAQRGSTDAMLELYFYYQLKGDAADQAQALIWLRMAAKAGMNSARVRLAATLIAQDAGARSSAYDEAMKLLSDAYANGYNLAGKFQRHVVADNASIAPISTGGSP